MCVCPCRDVQALWSNEHALAWHLGDDFRADPVAWARTQCLNWEELEDQLPKFLEELPDCPCTLAQARADSGRFHVSLHPGQGPGTNWQGGKWSQLPPPWTWLCPPRTIARKADRVPWEVGLGSKGPCGGGLRMAEPDAGAGDSNSCCSTDGLRL